MLEGNVKAEMAVGLSAGVRIGRGWRIPRQAIALACILAMLFQAVLFAWHHHAAPFHARATAATTTLAAPSAPVIPASDEHDCQICFTLNHHGAVPVDFFVAKPPQQAPLRQVWIAAVDTPLAAYLLFRSRAPPPV